MHNFDIRHDRNQVRHLKPLSCCQVPWCREEFFLVRDGRNTASDLQRKKKDMRQAGSDDKGPHWSLGSEIKNAQSNHLTPLSRAVAPPMLKWRENGKMGEEKGIEK